MIEELARELEALAAAHVHVQRRKDEHVENQEFGREDLAEHGRRLESQRRIAARDQMPILSETWRLRAGFRAAILRAFDLKIIGG